LIKIDELLQNAIGLHKSGKLKDAEIIFVNIIKNEPGNVEALFRLGTLKYQQGDKESSIKLLSETVRLKPDYPEAFVNLGNAFLVTAQFDNAVMNYSRAIELNPHIPEAFNNRGVAFRKTNRLNEAVDSFRKAIELNPGYVSAFNNLGAALKDLREFAAAESAIKKALSLKPDHAEAYNNLGVVLRNSGRFDEAGENLLKAVSIKPDYTEAYNNLGTLYRDTGRHDDAINSYTKALELRPGYIEALNNFGIALRDQGKLDEALEKYDTALSLMPDNLEVRWNKSLTLLLKGDYLNGWKYYETRLLKNSANRRRFTRPRWDGTRFDGKTIFVYAEQGYGDTFQFIRFLPQVKALGGKVIFECQKGLTSLLQRCAGIDEIVERSDNNQPGVEFDIHVPLMSLPGVLGCTLENLPEKTPYILPDSDLVEQWQSYLNSAIQNRGKSPDKIFKIGIVWSGNPTHENDRNRSCPFEYFDQLRNIEGVVLVSLQKGDTSVQIKKLPDNNNILNIDKDLKSFHDTAAVIANLDLVISVDTSVAHLAAASGRKTGIILPHAPDWRWLLNREDSPWYPAMKLFRQSIPGDWKGVFKRINEHLISK